MSRKSRGILITAIYYIPEFSNVKRIIFQMEHGNPPIADSLPAARIRREVSGFRLISVSWVLGLFCRAF